jgi:hypothetical protein
MNITEWEKTANLVVEWTIHYRNDPFFELCEKSGYCQRPNGHGGECFPVPPFEDRDDSRSEGSP